MKNLNIAGYKVCPTCRGTGLLVDEVLSVRQLLFTSPREDGLCRRCGGSGRVFE